MHIFQRKIVPILFVFVSFLATAQFNIPKKPSIETSVYDYANILTKNERNALEQKLIRYSDSTSTQIVIATIQTLNGDDIGIITPKWAHEWGIGQAKEDNGVFILLAQKERKIWISPGYGIEPILTAGITGTIVRNTIIPEFKNGNFYRGFDKGIDEIFNALNGNFKASEKKEKSSKKKSSKFFIILVFIIIYIILSGKKNSGRGGRGGRNAGLTILEAIILSGAGRSSGSSFGGGGFGGSSGGFGGGFGGGGFSGGGAGGSW